MAKVIFFLFQVDVCLLKIVFIFKFHQLHAKISTPTGTPVPDEKVKEFSSTGRIADFVVPYPQLWINRQAVRLILVSLDLGDDFCHHAALAEVDEIGPFQKISFGVLCELDHGLEHSQKRDAWGVDLSQSAVKLLIPLKHKGKVV